MAWVGTINWYSESAVISNIKTWDIYTIDKQWENIKVLWLQQIISFNHWDQIHVTDILNNNGRDEVRIIVKRDWESLKDPRNPEIDFSHIYSPILLLDQFSVVSDIEDVLTKTLTSVAELV